MSILLVSLFSLAVLYTFVRLKWHDVTSHDRFVAITTWATITLISLLIASHLQ